MSAFALLFILALQTTPAQAGVYMCPKVGGGTAFQDSPCAVVQKEVPTKKPTKKVYPLGIHASWFDKPGHAPDKAFCSKNSCDCGPFSRRLKSGLSRAVADALYLDGSWHRLENALVELKKIRLAQSNQYDAMYEVKEAACNVLMSQKILTQYASSVLTTLSAEVKQITNDSATLLEECQTGLSESCDSLDQLQLKQQIESDAEALKRVRIEEHDNYGVIAESD